MAHERLNPQNREIRLATLSPRDDSSQPPLESTPTVSPSIKISLQKVSLNGLGRFPPTYAALSYVWGNPVDTIPILVDGVEFLATRNLVAALTQLQTSFGDAIPLWIDAVCINQSDNEEKSSQIQLMKQIYESSLSTIVWLGDDADGSEAVMKMWSGFVVRPEVQAVFEESKIARLTTPLDQAAAVDRETYQISKLMIEDPSIPTHSSHPALSSTQVSLTALLNREYWFRVWCLQEISVPKNTLIACGKGGHGIGADAFGKIIRYYIDLMVMVTGTEVIQSPDLLELINTKSPYLSGNVVDSVNGATMMLDQRTRYRDVLGQQNRSDESGHHGEAERSADVGHPKLLDYLIDAYASKNHKVSLRSTDPRDMIYGLLNLASDVEELGIIPNYDKTCEQVYTETWAAILRRHGAGPLVLAVPEYVACVPPSSSAGPNEIAVPSWVPDWRQAHTFHVMYQSELFLACGERHRQTQWVPTEDPRVIALRGVQIDIVREIGNPLSSRKGDIPSMGLFIDEITQFLDKSSLSAPSPEESVYPTPEDNHSARWRIPLCDLEGTLGFTERSSITRATSASEKNFLSTLAVIEGQRQASAPGLGGEAAATLSRALGQNLQRLLGYGSTMSLPSCSRPFLTSRGWVGRGPAEMKDGDVVVILWGCRLPIVLRPCGGDADDQKYQLVGDAYVHGIMDGEFVQGDVEREERTFQLC